ncbi:hypothetical protein [Nocardiopsis trehalosi]|nr:hypothetical protein [Nocardiopsis trehalosi]
MSKPTESKAGPLGKDIMAMVMAIVVAVVPMGLFAAMGMGIAAASGSL